MNDFLHEMKNYINETFSKLENIYVEKASIKGNKNWSTKEIIGHLIDSASNNHQRFIRAQFTNDLIFPSYDQDKWVEFQNYQEADWKTLIELWRSFNLILLHSISEIPQNILLKKRSNHNLDEIAWESVEKSKYVTLEYFIKDYYSHMKHHIDQLLKLNSNI